MNKHHKVVGKIFNYLVDATMVLIVVSLLLAIVLNALVKFGPWRPR